MWVAEILEIVFLARSFFNEGYENEAWKQYLINVFKSWSVMGQ